MMNKMFGRFSPLGLYIMMIGIGLWITGSFISYAEVQNKDLLVIGTLDDFPIMYADQEGSPKGLAVDLLEAFGTEHGYRISYELYPSSQVNSVFADHGDLLYDGGSKNLQNKPTVSLPFYYKNYSLITTDKNIPKNLSRSTLTEYLQTYQNQNVSVGFKGSAEDAVKFTGNLNALPLKPYQKYSDLIADLKKETLKFALIPDELSKLIIPRDFISNLYVVPITVYIEDSTFELSSNEKDLVYELNHYLLGIKKDNTLSTLTRKWFTLDSVLNKSSKFLFYFNILGVLSVIIVLMLAYKNVIMQKILDQKTMEIVEHTRVNELLFEKLLQEEQYKNSYFMNLSHELRTPISIVLNASQMCELALKNSAEFSGKAKSSKYINVINANGYRLLRIITDLIDLNRIQAKEYSLKFESTNLLMTLEQLIHSIVENEYLKLDQFQIESNEEEILLDGDPYELSRIFATLISTSCKFSSGSAKILIQMIQTNQHIVVQYRDQSQGISESQINELLDSPYHQNPSLVMEQQSFGLGLYLAKELLKLHRADLKVTSDELGLCYQIRFNKSLKAFGIFSESIRRPNTDLNQLVRMEFSEIQNKPQIVKAQ